MTITSTVFPRAQVGLGTFPFASAFGEVAPQTADRIVKEYLAQGGYYLDTAPTYAFGEVEQRLGELLQHHSRDSFFVNTSCGYVRKGDAFEISGRAKDVQEDLQGSLERLRLDYIDSYISHIPDINTPFSETVEALEHAKQRGLVHHIGVSNVTYEQLFEYKRYGSIELVQHRYSLINRSISEELLDLCEAEGIGIVAYQVIERGLLTGRSEAELEFPSTDLRSRKPEFGKSPRHLVNEWVSERLLPVAHELGSSIESISIAWALAQPGVVATQSGASKPEQLKALADARTLRLSDATLTEIEAAYEELQERAIAAGYPTVRTMLGLEGRDPLSGLSASGR